MHEILVILGALLGCIISYFTINKFVFYTKSEIDTKLTSAMHYKGSVAAVANLPSTGNVVGDFYNVTATGENYAWTGSEWDVTGSIVDLVSITNSEIDTIVAS